MAHGPLCSSAPELTTAVFVCFGGLFGHLPGFLPRSLFQVFSEIVFTEGWFLSTEHPVSVLFGQRALLLGKAIFFPFVPGAPF